MSITLGVLSLAFVAFVVVFIIAFTGVPWAHTTPPKETDKEVVAANTAGNVQRDKLASEVQAIGTAGGLVQVASSPPVVSCDPGQHNWKVKNDYDLKCSTSASVFLGGSSPSWAEIGPRLLAFHDQVIARGWRSRGVSPLVRHSKEVMAGPGGSAAPPLGLHLAGLADYDHGPDTGGPGSALMSMNLTDNASEYNIKWFTKEPSYGPPVLSYLQGGSDRYITEIKITYETFSK